MFDRVPAAKTCPPLLRLLPLHATFLSSLLWLAGIGWWRLPPERQADLCSNWLASALSYLLTFLLKLISLRHLCFRSSRVVSQLTCCRPRLTWNGVVSLIFHCVVSLVVGDYSNDIALYFKSHYYRYLDDIFIIYDENKLSLTAITTFLNSLCDNLNFKLESFGQQVHFLDIFICNTDGTIQTDIFYKPTDSRQYLNFHSNHPGHVKRALPYNLARRICTIVSNKTMQVKRLNELFQSLKKCNYPSALIEDGIKKALSYDRNILLYPIQRDVDDNIIVHVSSYNPNYDSHSNIVQQMFDELKVSKFTKNIFANKKLIQSKRQPPNLKNILTQAKFCTLNKQCVSKCNSPRCQLCEIIIQGDYFRFKNVNYNFLIKSHMTCDTRNCVYVIECTGCYKYYIGETGNFRLRTNLHRDHTKKNEGLGVNKHIFHCTVGKSIKHAFRIMPIYKVKEDDTDLRRNMEEYLINKLKPDLNS